MLRPTSRRPTLKIKGGLRRLSSLDERNAQVRHDILQRASTEILVPRDELGRPFAREEDKTLLEQLTRSARRLSLPFLCRQVSWNRLYRALSVPLPSRSIQDR
jgi:hypothetical protein